MQDLLETSVCTHRARVQACLPCACSLRAHAHKASASVCAHARVELARESRALACFSSALALTREHVVRTRARTFGMYYIILWFSHTIHGAHWCYSHDI